MPWTAAVKLRSNLNGARLSDDEVAFYDALEANDIRPEGFRWRDVQYDRPCISGTSGRNDRSGLIDGDWSSPTFSARLGLGAKRGRCPPYREPKNAKSCSRPITGNDAYALVASSASPE